MVIYYTVHEDFSKLNPPRMDTPIMPDAQYLEAYKKSTPISPPSSLLPQHANGDRPKPVGIRD